MMERRRLGASGLDVSVLSLGAMTFGSGMPPITTVDEREARAMVDRALDAGVNLVDTADVYADGQSEEILGAAVKGRRDDVLLATKVGFGTRDPGALSYDNVVAACEGSLRRLGTDRIDLYQLHRPDRTTPMEETLRALDDLVARGLVRETGTSNFRAFENAAAVAHQRALGRPAFTAAQLYYSLVGREAEHELIPECRADDLGVIVWSPLSSGYLTGRYREGAPGGRRTTFTFPPVDPDLGARGVEAVAAVAAAHGVSMAQVALAWVLAQPGITSAIVGASSVEQLDDNLAAAALGALPGRGRHPRRRDRAGADLPGVVGSGHGHPRTRRASPIPERTGAAVSEWTNRDDRQADAKAQYEHIMTTPAPPAIGAYIDAGVIGFVFGEMWRRGVLTPRDRRWLTLACVGAADAPIPMETHTYAALNSGDVTNEEIDEFLLFFGTQMGWPKGSAMNTHILTAMAKIAEERGEELRLPQFVPWTDPADDGVRRARGEAAYAEVHGVPPAPAPTAFRGRAYLDYLYGEVWTRDEYLTRRDRRLVSICCSAELGADDETTEHLEAALRSGELTYEELQEVVMHVAVYLGWIVARRLDDLLVAAATRTGIIDAS